MKTLSDLITAALETGCRLGELLSLQWSQVRGDLFLPAGKKKAKKPRRVPISSVLKAVLDRRRKDPAGEDLPADGYVFGDEGGRKRRSIKTAWRLTCKRAKIDGLHFHDLRREAGSRWMDAGVPLATIQRWLGHHNISQTSTYLAASGGGDAEAMRAFAIATGQLTNVDQSTGSNGSDRIPSSSDAIEKTQSNVVVHEPARVKLGLGVKGAWVRIPPSRPIFYNSISEVRPIPQIGRCAVRPGLCARTWPDATARARCVGAPDHILC